MEPPLSQHTFLLFPFKVLAVGLFFPLNPLWAQNAAGPNLHLKTFSSNMEN